MRLQFSALILALTASSVSLAKTEYFPIKAFSTPPSSQEDIQKGLRALYKNQISDSELQELTEKSLQFQDSVYSHLNQAIALNPMHPAEISERRLTGNFVKETTIRFQSLIHRGNHASDQVVARIYESAVSRKFCDYKYPTTIFLHHILNEVEKIELAGKIMASGVLSQSSIVAVIQMPHYAQRRQGSEEFLNSDLGKFRQNIAQTVLDVHLLKNFLETRNNVDTQNISLSGFSLGGVMGLTVGAFDQSYSGYGFLVAGVDMANILMNRVRNRPDSEVAVALKDMPQKEESIIRHEIASVDPMTWLHRYQGKRYFALNADQDDIVDYKNSVQPLLESLRSQGNQITTKLNRDGHTPTGSGLKKFREIFVPLNDFIINKAPSFNSVCSQGEPTN